MFHFLCLIEWCCMNTHKSQIFIGFGLVFLGLAIILVRSNVSQIRNTSRPVPRQVKIERIASWMTIPYVSRVYRIPAQDLFAAISHDPSVIPNDSIEAIARADHKEATQLIKLLQATVLQEQHPQ